MPASFALAYLSRKSALSRTLRSALLEIKYLPIGAKTARIEAAFREAALQVERYASDSGLVRLLTGGKELRAGSLVFVGAKTVLFRPGPGEEREEAAKKPRRSAKPMAT